MFYFFQASSQQIQGNHPPFSFHRKNPTFLTELGMIFCLLIPHGEVSTESKEFGDSSKRAKEYQDPEVFFGDEFS